MRALVSATALSAIIGAGVVVAAPAFAGTETISINVSANQQVGQQLTVSGQVTGAPAEEMVSAERDDQAGTHTLPGAMTHDGGQYSFTDTPSVRGQVTYKVTVVDAAAATNQATVAVAGKPSGLRLSLGSRVVVTGHSEKVTAHVPSGPTNRSVTIYARPYGRDLREVDSGAVDVNGNRSVLVILHRRTTFSVHINGDAAYAPTTVRRVARVRAVLHERLQGGYGHAGGFRLYHPGSNPSVFVQMLPRQRGMCLHFRAQHYYSGSWHNSTVSPCERTNADGQLIGVLTGNHVVGEPYRVRAEWRGNTALLARHGTWLRLKFHR